MPIWVFEGPDFAGKSTITRRIVAELSARSPAGPPPTVVHVGQPVNDRPLLDVYVEHVERALSESDRGVSFLYGPIFRGASQLSLAQLAEIDIRLDAGNTRKLHVDSQDDDLIERFRGTRGDDLIGDESTLLNIAQRYRDLLGAPLVSGALPWRRVTPDISVDELLDGVS